VRHAGDRPALRQIGGLFVPPPELEPTSLEPSIELRYRIGAIKRVQQRVGERVRPPEILRAPRYVGDRMIVGERADQVDRIRCPLP
jgi:hypothetical protein